MKISSLTKENKQGLVDLGLTLDNIKKVVECFNTNKQVKLWISVTKEYHEKYERQVFITYDYIREVFYELDKNKTEDFIFGAVSISDVEDLLNILNEKNLLTNSTLKDTIKQIARKRYYRATHLPYSLKAECVLNYQHLVGKIKLIRSIEKKFIIKDFKSLKRYNGELNIADLFNKGIIGIKHPDNVPSKFEPVSYKYLIDKYFGIDYQEVNGKLSTQLRKAKVDATQKEMAFFGSIKAYFDKALKRYLVDTIYVDSEDFRVPDIVDNWAFNGSCNTSESTAGRDTHLFHRNIGGSYLRGYFHEDGKLHPFLRMYFYQHEGELMHSGIYSRASRIELELSTVLLCVLFNKRIGDFEATGGLPFPNTNTWTSSDGKSVRIWHNMNENNNYTVLSTDGDKIRDYLLSEYDYKEVIKNNFSILHYLSKRDRLEYGVIDL